MSRFFWDHIKKGLQIGSVFGTAVVLPMTLFQDFKNAKKFSINRLFLRQATSLVAGIGLSLVWMTIRYLSWSDR